MAQTGFTPISNYYSATAAAVPTAGNLVAGELAINTNDGKLFYKDSSGVVQTIATKATAALPSTTTGSGNVVLSTSPTLVTPALGTPSAIVLTNATGLGYGAMPAGSVLQVVQTTYGTMTSTSSTSYVDTGITATITPKFATSKILVFFSAYTQVGGDSDNGMGLRLVRDSTSVWSTVGSNVIYFYTNNGGINYSATHAGTQYLDSPATTSATTYKVQMRSDGTGASNDIYIQFQSATSTITLMEIAG
jgi:hypothetical protein